MDLSLTEDQQSVQKAFADFFSKESTVERVRAAEPLGFDERLWEQLVATGATTMGMPEDVGGGAGTLELVLVAEEFGRHIAPVPLVESVVAGNTLARVRASDLVDLVVDGSVLPTIALSPIIGGVARLVPAGAVAEVVVVRDGSELVALHRPAATRPHVEPPPNLGSNPIADWHVDAEGVVRTVLASGDEARRIYDDALAEWKVLMAAAMNGIRAAALGMAVDYVKERKAFGVPIGWFQAIQHRLADVTVDGDGGQLLVYEAAWARDNGLEEAPALASMAFLQCSEVAFKTCRESLQFHGGYGYTLEYDIQLYFRRAKAWPLALGDPRREYQRLAELIYVEPTA